MVSVTTSVNILVSIICYDYVNIILYIGVKWNILNQNVYIKFIFFLIIVNLIHTISDIYLGIAIRKKEPSA